LMDIMIQSKIKWFHHQWHLMQNIIIANSHKNNNVCVPNLTRKRKRKKQINIKLPIWRWEWMNSRQNFKFTLAGDISTLTRAIIFSHCFTQCNWRCMKVTSWEF
jgi:hypothetical protein